MTQFALIYDESCYQLAQLIAIDKKSVTIKAAATSLAKKIKLDYYIISVEADTQATLETAVTTIKRQVDVELLWELSNEHTGWTWEELTSLYFSEVSTLHKLGLFLAIATPEIYFNYLVQEQQFKRCNPEEIKQHKLQIQRQHEYQQRFNAIYSCLVNKQRPEWQIDPLILIHKPDKATLEYKAALKASKELKLSLAELLFELGYIKSVEELLTTTFIKHYFPLGTQLEALELNDHSEEIQLNRELKVFSIDDSTTTEIDDAFSVQALNDGWIIGIHIAAPALNKQLLPIASSRLSTVYYPGHKITMLPEHVINHYSLDQGKQLPVISIYFSIDNNYQVNNHETKLEQVIIASNLRTEALEQLFNHENLALDHGYPYEQELKLLYKFALSLEEKRGRPSVNQLSIDYNFSFNAAGEIIIKPRLRGNPIDKLVSELMILANCSWGRMLTNSFIPAIYRVKQPRQPVAMTLSPNSHTGLNVDYYTWATSPLRRAVDLINQAQIISLLTKSKPLAATDFAVANVVTNFDTTYSAYLKFQDSMEHYWSLRYWLQENITQVNATVTFKNMVQLEGVPITLDLSHLITQQAPGSLLKLTISNINLVNQTFDYKILP